MRADLIGLKWFSVEQALLWLKDEAGVELLENDLLAQCDAGRCAVYLNVDNLKGVCFEGLRDEHDERFHTVYGVGKGQVINPRVFIEVAGTVEVELDISGEVRQLQLAEADSRHAESMVNTNYNGSSFEVAGYIAPVVYFEWH
ncbi:hypothetical protein [Pseudomonas sp. ANT_H12B]|uniref:hypothetical protein n=1 Tax=Pseudomonas sp. ANT_H12B TaxID=2597348 RepID=UPI0011EF565D|nr:hypothetical protein [Pseudomonas sp. ANT_H12B]KAA0970071.1 hypothetical protein FQ185_17565 [Pseudomonas sp. ANT_H12B]